MNSWLTTEDKILIEKYPEIGPEVANMIPRHPLSSIYGRAFKLNLPSGRTWKNWEDKIIDEKYPEGGSKAVHEVIPYRTHKSIRERARRIYVRRIKGE